MRDEPFAAARHPSLCSSKPNRPRINTDDARLQMRKDPSSEILALALTSTPIQSLHHRLGLRLHLVESSEALEVLGVSESLHQHFEAIVLVSRDDLRRREISESHRPRKQEAHRITAPRAPVVGLTGDLEVVKLSEEASDLVRHNSKRGGGGGIDFGGGLGLRSGAGGGERDVGGREGSASGSRSAMTEPRSAERATNPLGCCKTETMSSTAIELAIEAIPGRVTVHI
jgi:hypothetical protein